MAFFDRLSRVAAVAGAAFLAFAPAASGADITFRADLVDRLSALKPIYPVQGPVSVLGDDAPFTSAPGDGPGWVSTDSRRQQPTTIVVSGQIEKGDADKLRQMIEATTGYIDGIVFNSPGGNFLEGFRIAEAVRYSLESQDPNVGGVYVLGGEACLSACAIAFALSVDLAHPGVPDTRYIEDGARVGFHMGLLPAEKADEVGRVGDVLNLSYDITGAFNRLLVGGANPPRLLARALEHRTPDSFYILTGDIVAWYMGFTPVSAGMLAKPALLYGFDLDIAGRLCRAYLQAGRAWRASAEEEFSFFYTPPERSGSLLADFAAAAGSEHVAQASHGGFSCQYRLGDADKVRISLWRGDRRCVGGTNDDPEAWCGAEKRGTSVASLGFLADALGCSGGRLTPGSDPADPKRRGTIKREVNMRAEPSLQGAVLTSLPVGSAAEIADCTLVDGVQGVWYKVAVGSKTGWVSARFVEEQYPPLLPLGE